jgi:hypothetical protein
MSIDLEYRRAVFCDPDFTRDRIAMEALTGNRRAAVAMVREQDQPALWIAVRADSATTPGRLPFRG